MVKELLRHKLGEVIRDYRHQKGKTLRDLAMRNHHIGLCQTANAFTQRSGRQPPAVAHHLLIDHDDLDYWDQWIEWLRIAADHGGFRVW